MKHRCVMSIILSWITLVFFGIFASVPFFTFFLRVDAAIFAVAAMLTIVSTTCGAKRSKALSIVIAIIEIAIGVFGVVYTLNYVPGVLLCLLGIITIIGKRITNKQIACVLVVGVVVSLGVYGAVIVNLNSIVMYIGMDRWSESVSNAIGECILAICCLFLVLATALTPSSRQTKRNITPCSAVQERPCPMCGKTISSEDISCGSCGHVLRHIEVVDSRNELPNNNMDSLAEDKANNGVGVHQARFCRKCGASLISNSNFCSSCGAKVITEIT